MKLQTVQGINIVTCAVALVFGLAFYALDGSMSDSLSPETQEVIYIVLAVICLAAVLAVGVINILYWRCPHCGHHLGRRQLFPRYCSDCGRSLWSDDEFDEEDDFDEDYEFDENYVLDENGEFYDENGEFEKADK